MSRRGRKKNEEKTEKSFSVVSEAEEIIKRLAARYPKVLFAVKPEEICVLGVENQTRQQSNKALAKIQAVSDVYKVLFEKHGIKTRYIITLYWDDFNSWNQNKRQWVLLHECLHCPTPNEKSLVKHDIQDFGLCVDKIGVEGYEDAKSLPSLLEGDPIEFREDLLIRLHSNDDSEDSPSDDTPVPPE